MATKQINLKLPSNLYDSAESFAHNYGYRNVQELITESMREKIFEKSDFDNSFTEKEIDLIDSLISKSIAKGKIADWKEIAKAPE
ncbi:MAG: hypothetical protein WC602_03875 [archaeon]